MTNNVASSSTSQGPVVQSRIELTQDSIFISVLQPNNKDSCKSFFSCQKSKQMGGGGVTLLVSEIKRVGNAVMLEVLVMEGEIGFLASRIKIGYVEDSRQCLFIHFIANRPI